jgi:hypothetical protein
VPKSCHCGGSNQPESRRITLPVPYKQGSRPGPPIFELRCKLAEFVGTTKERAYTSQTILAT